MIHIFGIEIKRKSLIVILSAIIILVVLYVFLTIFCRPDTMEFNASEVINKDENLVLSSFPLKKTDVLRYLESQYVEYDDSTGFALVINDPYSYKNINFAYYILGLAEAYDINLGKDTINEYKKYFEKYQFDFKNIELEDLYYIAKVSRVLGSTFYNDDIIDVINQHYLSDTHLYSYNMQSEQVSNDEESIISDFGATSLVVEIYHTLNMPLPELNNIKSSYKSNVRLYLGEISKETTDKPLNYFNLIGLSNKLSEDLSEFNLSLEDWIRSVNDSLKNQRSYTYEETRAVVQIYESNTFLCYSQEEIEKYINEAPAIQIKKSGFNQSETFASLIIVNLSKDLETLLPEPPDMENYIFNCVNTYFIKRDVTDITAMYTYYGVVLSKQFDFMYHKDKLLNTFKNKFLPNVLSPMNVGNVNYILDLYFTTLLSAEIDYKFSAEEIKMISGNLQKLVDVIDFNDMTKMYENLYTLQFSLEISKCLKCKIPNGSLSAIKNYLSYLVNNQKCENTSRLSEIKLIYDYLDVPPSETLKEQLTQMGANLLVKGGFRANTSYDVPDVITTAKVYRVTECDNSTALKDFLCSNIVESYIAPNNDITQTDLRYYYSFVKLWVEEGMQL